MTTVYLARHAHTDWLAAGAGRLAGRLPGIPLNPLGRAEAAALAAALSDVPLDRIVSSPVERAVETATAVGEVRGLAVLRDDRLTEWGMGVWEGRVVAELLSEDAWRVWREDPERLAVEGAEAVAVMAYRMAAAFWDHAEQGRSVLLVSHQDPLLALLCRLLDAPLARMRAFEVLPASLSVVDVSDRRAVIRATNLTGHLQDVTG